jgi:hypothetical protein
MLLIGGQIAPSFFGFDDMRVRINYWHFFLPAGPVGAILALL